MLTYVLSDHLGSTSLVTDASGQVISQTKYKAWGEVRQATGTSPTNYTYTGQYSYTADFGLMYYNARWYDPALGRFAQADSIVPGGVQGLDRYAYVNNSPMNFSDPSGHCAMDDSMDDCYNSANVKRSKDLVNKTLSDRRYGKYALNSVANLYGLRIAPGDNWEYEPLIYDWEVNNGQITGEGVPIAGRTPRTDTEWVVFESSTNGLIGNTGLDSSVFITGSAFKDLCSMDLHCIAGIMAHEATHSWVEYLTTTNPAANPYVTANEEIIADEVALNSIGDSNISTYPLKNHQNNKIQALYPNSEFNINQSLNVVGGYYGINNLTVDLLVGLVIK